jgi:hypothetical protein
MRPGNGRPILGTSFLLDPENTPKSVPTKVKENPMSIAKVTEIIASSPKSFDDAIRLGVARAHKTLTNLKSAWVENQQVQIDDDGNILEFRVQLKITFVLND